MSEDVILGAGLAGLGCAHHLPGARIFEAAGVPGGHARSHEMAGAFFDEGAHICHSPDEAWTSRLFENAGDVIHISASAVSNYWHGHWVTYPVQNHLHDLPEDARQKALSGFITAQEEMKGLEPRNYEEWCICQYGRYLTENFYRPYTDKYWRTPMSELSTDWLAGRLLPSQVDRIMRGATGHQEEKQSTFARFHYPSRGGFFSFFKKMFDGADISLGAKAAAVDPRQRRITFADGRTQDYRSLVSTIPLVDLISMLTDKPDRIAAAGKQLRHTHLLCVNMVLKKKVNVPHHWFYIYDSDVEIARVSVLSNFAPQAGHGGHAVLQAEIYRRGNEAFDVERVKAGAVRDLGRVLGFDPAKDVLEVATVHVPHAYIISDTKRAEAVAGITKWLEQNSIYPAGLFGSWQFIWSDKAYQAGQLAAEKVKARAG